MRMAGAVALLVVLLEVLVALGFLAGFFWVGGLRGGLLVGGVLLLLIVVPWLGDLRVWFDSAGPAGTVKLSWWGRVSFRTLADASEVRVRFLMIPWRRRMERPESKPAPAEPESAPAAAPAEEKAPEKPPAPEPKQGLAGVLRRVDAETIEGFSRMLGAGLQALNELTWGAAEMAVRVDDPTQQAVVDQTLAKVVARREVGPLDLMLAAGGGDRRVRLRYRIGILRMALAGLQVAVDGRALALAKTMKQKKRAEEEARSEDQKLIEEIIEAREDGPDV